MARVGELLVAAGWITAEQCVQALNAQVLWGARLGTNLIELGFVDLDQVARALGRQHQCPAALSHHFAGCDRQLQRELAADIAERFSVVPLSRARDGRVVVASIGALDDRARLLIANALDTRDLVVAVAAELRIRYQLEKVYRIQRDTRFLRVRGPMPAHVPQFDINPVTFDGPELEIPEEQAPRINTPRSVARIAMSPLPRPGTAPPMPDVAPRGTLPPTTGGNEMDAAIEELKRSVEDASFQRAVTKPDRRRYLPTIDQNDPDVLGRAPTLARVPVKRLAIGTDGIPPVSMGTNPPPISNTLGEATRAIRCSNDRNNIEALVIQAVAQFLPTARAALLLVVRNHAAIAHVGFSRVLESLPEVAVPLGEPGLVPDAIEANGTMAAPARELGVVDRLVLSSMGFTDGDYVVAPISIGVHVVGVLVIATEPQDSAINAASITAAAGAAFARLMRDATK